MPSLPSTSVRTDHAISIRVSGTTIGRIQEWSPMQNRTVTAAYEINSATDGGVYENIPGVINGLTISVVRFDLYNTKMEEAWGPDFNIYMLTDQRNPIVIKERWKKPDGSEETWTYTGCWFTSLGRNHSAQGDRITRVNANLVYLRKYKTDELVATGERIVDNLWNQLFK